MKFISEKLASSGILLILSLIIFFHFLVLTGVIPFNLVWGGRLKDAGQMQLFESISIALNLLMLAVVAMYTGFLKLRLPRKVLTVLLYGMAGLFLLNTAGNLLSEDPLEKLLFTPLTFILAVFSFRLASGKPQKTAG